MTLATITRGYLRKMVRMPYLKVRNLIMERSGLQPRGTLVISNDFAVTDYTANLSSLPLPNLATGYRSSMAFLLAHYGLSGNVLLVSENKSVAAALNEHFPEARFHTCDLFADLMEGEAGVDFLWDVCTPLKNSEGSYQSVVCHALLEHVIDPTAAIRNTLHTLQSNGTAFFMTHTPSFHYHAYPRDYVRFHVDYFQDLPAYLEKGDGLEVELKALIAEKGVVSVVYQRKGSAPNGAQIRG